MAPVTDFSNGFFLSFQFRYDEKNKQFAILVIQLSNVQALLLQQDQKV